jgi:hypothetical protein
MTSMRYGCPSAGNYGCGSLLDLNRAARQPARSPESFHRKRLFLTCINVLIKQF